MTPVHLSLFTGIGGFDQGFDQAGMFTVEQVEINPFCKRVLERHYAATPRTRDIHEFDGRRYAGSVDVVSFGSPCQGLSVAGRRAGLADPRSSLFFCAARIIGECRPAFAVWENVPGAFSSDRGRDFRAVLLCLVELGARDIAWRVIDARYAGVPQQRARVVLVADFRGERAGQVLYHAEACTGHPRAGAAAGEAARSAADGGARGSGGAARYPPEVARTFVAGQGKRGQEDPDCTTYIPEAAYCLCDETGGRTGSGRAAQDTYIATLQDVRSDRKRPIGSGVRNDGVMYTLDQVSTHAVAFEARAARNGRGGRPRDHAPALRAENDTSSRGGGATLLVYDETQVTSPGNYSTPNHDVSHPLAAGETARCVCADGPRQRALGNACAVPVAAFVGRRIVGVLR